MTSSARLASEHRQELARRIDRHRAFYQGGEPGDLLVLPNPWASVNLAARLAGALAETSVQEFCRGDAVTSFIRAFLVEFRENYPAFYEIPGDAVPAAPVFPHIGSVTAAMTGLQPVCANGTVTLTSNMTWEQIDGLAFNADSPWIQFLALNRALWDMWDEDYLIMPYFHRTPLDAAQGIRGAQLFEDMYRCPHRVKALADWCADWSISLERLLAAELDRPAGWGCGIWNCWLPDGAVVANGDAVGMISRQMHGEFEKPYTEKFFSATGGGLFHNHGLGLHQVDLVAATEGLLLQEIMPDPNRPHPVAEMLTDPAAGECLVAASLVSPIRLDGIAFEDLAKLLPIARQGRFILCVPTDDPDQQHRVVELVRACSNIK